MLCVVDDAHWLDPATAGALLFCARRLGADRVAMVFATRDGAWETFDPHGLSELVLTGLEPDAARALLDAAPGGRTRRGGHPAAHRRDARQPAGPAGAARRAHRGPAPRVRRRCRRSSTSPPTWSRSSSTGAGGCPRPVQSVLLLAAADDTGDLDVLRRASAGLGLDEHGPGGRPGLRAARRRRDRRSRCATRWCGRRSTRPRRVRTGAALTGPWPRPWPAPGTPTVRPGIVPPPPTGPDHGAGRPPSSSSGHEHSDAAGTSPPSRPTSGQRRCPPTRRSVPASRSRQPAARGRAGRPATPRSCSSAAREGATDPLLICDIARLRGHIEVNLGSATEAHRIFVEAAHAVHPFDPVRALEIGVAAAVMRTYGADSGTPLPVGRPPRGARRRRLAPDAVSAAACWSP